MFDNHACFEREQTDGGSYRRKCSCIDVDVECSVSSYGSSRCFERACDRVLVGFIVFVVSGLRSGGETVSTLLR